MKVRTRMKAYARSALETLGYDIVATEDLVTLGGHLRKLLGALRVNCVVDVGGHTGEFGQFLRRLGFEGEIISIEPLTASFQALSAVAARESRWRTHQLALGNQDGELQLLVTNRTDLASFLKPNEYAVQSFGSRAEVVETQLVPVRRLDAILDSLVAHVKNPRILLKLDTQGYDLRVLEGAAGCLDRLLALQSEVSVKPIYEGMVTLPDALRRFGELGFEITGFFPVNVDADGLRVIEFDCVMVRPATRPPA